MKRPLINDEERIDRVVGNRTGIPDGLSTATSRKEDSIAWKKSLAGIRVLELVSRLRGDKPFLPKGVHRFRSFEDSEAWSIQMMARRPKPARQP